MKKIIVNLFSIIVTVTAVTAQKVHDNENKWTSARPDGHAPIGIMGDHMHHKGEFMFSYRYMPMWMDGNLSGSNTITDQEIMQAGFKVAPQKMFMAMHMLGAMYAPSDYITLMVMTNYVTRTMNLKALMNGMEFSTQTSGIGDLMVSALVKIMNKNKQSLHTNIGFSLPIGSLVEEDFLPALKKEVRLAYPMQLGSGTIDPQLGVTYLGQNINFSWGAQVLYKTRLGENEEKYTLGDKANTSVWGALKATDFLAFQWV